MTQNETSADLIAAMRRDAAEDDYTPDGILGQTLNDYADSFEAALKRERGDCSKLREALSKSCAYFAVVLNTGMFNRVHLEALLNMAKAALSAPPRNCDRPECATTKAAQDVWRKEDGGKTAYYEWLLATKTETEGGKKKHFDKDEFEKSLKNYRTGWNDIDYPIAEIRRLRGDNEERNFEPGQEGGEE